MTIQNSDTYFLSFDIPFSGLSSLKEWFQTYTLTVTVSETALDFANGFS